MLIDPAAGNDMQRYIEAQQGIQRAFKSNECSEEHHHTCQHKGSQRHTFKQKATPNCLKWLEWSLKCWNQKVPELEEKIKFLLIPVDPEDAKT